MAARRRALLPGFQPGRRAPRRRDGARLDPGVRALAEGPLRRRALVLQRWGRARSQTRRVRGPRRRHPARAMEPARAHAARERLPGREPALRARAERFRRPARPDRGAGADPARALPDRRGRRLDLPRRAQLSGRVAGRGRGGGSAAPGAGAARRSGLAGAGAIRCCCARRSACCRCKATRTPRRACARSRSSWRLATRASRRCAPRSTTPPTPATPRTCAPTPRSPGARFPSRTTSPWPLRSTRCTTRAPAAWRCASWRRGKPTRRWRRSCARSAEALAAAQRSVAPLYAREPGARRAARRARGPRRPGAAAGAARDEPGARGRDLRRGERAGGRSSPRAAAASSWACSRPARRRSTAPASRALASAARSARASRAPPQRPGSPLGLLRGELRLLARAPEWSARGARVPLRAGGGALRSRSSRSPSLYAQDRLRGSPLLFYGAVIDIAGARRQPARRRRARALRRARRRGLRALNPGLARGPLVAPTRASRSRAWSPRRHLRCCPRPSRTSRAVAGILTRGEGSSLSHVQLLARNLGIPERGGGRGARAGGEGPSRQAGGARREPRRCRAARRGAGRAGIAIFGAEKPAGARRDPPRPRRSSTSRRRTSCRSSGCERATPGASRGRRARISASCARSSASRSRTAS